MKKILLIAAIVLLAVACNKNQKVVNRLDGTWKATKFAVSDTTSSDTAATSIDLITLGVISSFTMTFEKCKLKDGDFCTMSTDLHYFLGDPVQDTSLFIVTGDGTTLEVKDDLSSTTIVKTDIIELTKTTLKTKNTDSDGYVVEVKLEKQK